MSDFFPKINPHSGIAKFQQLVDSIEYAVASNLLKVGDPLPSVNTLCNELNLSRDTVFKAYSELKNRGIVESYPNKGYYVASDRSGVFLFLDTFKAYKEVLYGSFRKSLPANYTVDLHFHHYNIDVFRNILTNAIGKYTHYIVMSFDHPDMNDLLNMINKDKLLVIDWNIHASPYHSFICQDFGQPVMDNLETALPELQKYDKLIYLYPSFTYHPKDSIDYFRMFCDKHNINCEILYDVDALDPKKGKAYFLVSDRTLAKLLEKTHEKGLVLGRDIGIISYNETPMKKYVKEGITVISTDFNALGQEAAKFVIDSKPVQKYIPTTIIKRASL